MSSSHPTIHARPGLRELALREADGVRVLLLWHPRDDALTVSVEDSPSGNRFEFPVERDQGLDAFYHPFAYAPERGIGFGCAIRDSLDLQPQN